MSGGYQQYSGNPYGTSGGSNPYTEETHYGGTTQYSTAGGYGQQNPYGSSNVRPQAQTQPSQMSEASRYDSSQATPVTPMPPTGAGPQSPPTLMTNHDFLARADAARSEMRTLTANIAEIGSIHQRLLSSLDSSSSAQLESLTTQTQILSTRIKDQIKYLETDNKRDEMRNKQTNATKNSQVGALHTSFKKQLEDYRQTEATYQQRYREQIQRQYKIVNPEATDSEVREAAEADWSNEGVFQTALKSNRAGAANSVLGSVRARHNDIQNIEKTMIELSQLFQDLAEQVDVQGEDVDNIDVKTSDAKDNTVKANQQLDSGIKHARTARKLKWWLFWIVVLIICILALVLGLVFGLRNNGSDN